MGVDYDYIYDQWLLGEDDSDELDESIKITPIPLGTGVICVLWAMGAPGWGQTVVLTPLTAACSFSSIGMTRHF